MRRDDLALEKLIRLEVGSEMQAHERERGGKAWRPPPLGGLGGKVRGETMVRSATSLSGGSLDPIPLHGTTTATRELYASCHTILVLSLNSLDLLALSRCTAYGRIAPGDVSTHLWLSLFLRIVWFVIRGHSV